MVLFCRVGAIKSVGVKTKSSDKKLSKINFGLQKTQCFENLFWMFSLLIAPLSSGNVFKSLVSMIAIISCRLKFLYAILTKVFVRRNFYSESNPERIAVHFLFYYENVIN